MYLKSIRINGFKSFADKIDLELNEGITAIVGPNGSGKSNIVDAIRWVLGEQSIKSLRGSEAMSDVIFSGSSSREAHKKASVGLVFDNHEHYLNSEFEEIEIKRVVYINGENEYYINNVKVRLKDITNLFIDSGAGVGAFNIISQGNITEIVNSKPQDRRIIFESAAGVLKYKKRKEEAIRKLDRTKENLKSISLVIDELSNTVLPLKEQSEKAKEYLSLKSELESIEIALIAEDISLLNTQRADIEIRLKRLEEENEKYQFSSQLNIEKYKSELLKIDDSISTINNQLIKFNEELSTLASEKQLTLERQKYSVDKTEINSILLKSKEEELELEKQLHIINSELELIEKDKNQKEKKLNILSNNLLKLKVKKSTITSNIDEKNRTLLYIQNKIEITKESMLNSERLPSSVKNIINNIQLKGVHNTIGNIIDVPIEYTTAISIILGASINFIVVDNYNCAKNCIEFLKSKKLGRATFFPIDTIKSRYIEKSTVAKLQNEAGFIGIASDLIKYSEKYRKIIENQLGNVIVVDNLKNLNTISQKYEYKYRCVTLEGDIVHVGGSITGGNKEINSNQTDKQILRKLENDYSSLKAIIQNLDNEQTKINSEYFDLLEQEELLNKELVILKEEYNNKCLSLKNIQSSLDVIKSEIAGSNNILNNKLDEQLISILEKYTKKSEEKVILENKLNDLKYKKSQLTDEITELELKERENIARVNRIQSQIKELEIEQGKNDVKIDSLLMGLSENYNLTYEAAKEKYSLNMEESIAREKVKSLKKSLAILGNVNLGAIEEYERLSTRYDFLNSQKSDLEKASEDLLEIIVDMDNIMISKYNATFEIIAKEFKEVFKTIFQGGKGELQLNNPNDLLSSGINIIAEPPGKKINSTIALSGGEQALTAICLLFAILNVRPVPFIILDEAEAALDEANVDMFGKYISNKKKDSQFVLITHKKRMMEYADILYGITMQESGVSKIVSAKLEG